MRLPGTAAGKQRPAAQRRRRGSTRGRDGPSRACPRRSRLSNALACPVAERESSFPIGAAATLARARGRSAPAAGAPARARARLVAAGARRLARDPPRPGADGDARPRALHRRRPALLDRPVVGPSMLTLEGGEHDRHRDPFARPFRLDPCASASARSWRARRTRCIDGVEPRGEAELRRALAGPLAARIVAFALGPAGHRDGDDPRLVRRASWIRSRAWRPAGR